MKSNPITLPLPQDFDSKPVQELLSDYDLLVKIIQCAYLKWEENFSEFLSFEVGFDQEKLERLVEIGLLDEMYVDYD